jgi:C4-dicarboxylate transporter/malic acid transport protein
MTPLTFPHLTIAPAPEGKFTPMRRRRLLTELDRPQDLFRHLGPNWFASVMGTGIVANAAVLLPLHVPGLHSVALGFWVLAAAMLLALGTATAVHWLRYPENARGHHRDPSMAPFYGAPAMAMLTVGAGALLIGKQLIGAGIALRVDEVLWTLGTITGLISAIAIPYLMFTEHALTVKDTYGSWLMPIVPPMVSAATGAGLIAHLPAGQDRLTLLLACLAMFGVSLMASVIVITLLWGRLATQGVGPARMVPTLWIVMGPLGQSITAIGLLSTAAARAVAGPYGSAMDIMAVLYGVPVWGFAIIWLVIAATITLRTARRQLPFALTWWSFTFPVGTVVTGTSELAAHTHAAFLVAAGGALYALLIAGWLAAAGGTARSALSGRAFLPASALRAVPAATETATPRAGVAAA